MKIQFDKATCRNLDSVMAMEWLSTNGLGGYCSATVAGVNTRKYHGYLVAAAHPPVGRFVLLSRVEDRVTVGASTYALSTNEFPDVIDPRGYENLLSFDLQAGPIWRYQCGAAVVEKKILLLQGQDTLIIRYDLLETAPRDQVVRLQVQPMLAGRDFHSTTVGPHRPQWKLADDNAGHRQMLLLAAAECPLPVYISHNAQRFNQGPCWWYNFTLRQEQARGYPDRDDLWTPGALEFSLSPGQPAVIICSTRPVAVDQHVQLCNAQQAYHQRVMSTFSAAAPGDEFIAQLGAAADQFLVRRGSVSDTHAGVSVIAGYPWFEDWGRDTFISLAGLTLTRGNYDAARSILVTFADHIQDGLIPNRFPDKSSEPDYNTVDAALWLVQAAYQYQRYTGDAKLLHEYLYRPLCQIIEKYRDGTRFGIRMDTDGLIRAGVPGVQLTWMDAKVGTEVITPRHGKPVEINALWYNALQIMELVAKSVGDTQRASAFADLARHCQQSFLDKFWNPSAKCLYDVIGDDGRPDASVRPNQILAVSLPFAVLTGDRAAAVVETVRRCLLTPLGIRTLAPGSPGYRGEYVGDQNARDHAYHQGTAWPWLTGQFVSALVKVQGYSPAARGQGREILTPFVTHLLQAGLGSISEIADGDAPWRPRGCIAQAWSVGEILRCYWEDVLGKAPAWPHEDRASLAGAPVAATVPL